MAGIEGRLAGLLAVGGVLALSGFALPATAEQPIAIIVSQRWEKAKELSLPMLRRIYLGKITQLYGERVERCDLPSGSQIREGFSRSVFGKSADELDDYWLEQALTGGHPPPREFRTAREVIEYVTRRPHAIGYVDYRELPALEDSTVRVLRVTVRNRSWHPEDPGYPVRYR